MNEDNKAYQATPDATLEQQIMDCRIPKNEREHWAKREIERLRAGQFRWIAVSERLPTRNEADAGGYVLSMGSGKSKLCFSENWQEMKYVRYWAPIPPPPEATQEEKDEELWREQLKTMTFFDDYSQGIARLGFLAGLKAARGQK